MSFLNFRAIACLIVLPVLLASCGSSPSIRGVPKNLPVINLHGSSETPAHSMEKKDYPFDTNGEYMTAWVSDGASSSSQSDYASWQTSHDGSVSKRNPATTRKSSSTKKKSTTSKSKSSGKGSSSYTIKSGDTLGAIAIRNGTTVAKLKAANGLTSDNIRAGKPLKIPK
jgi:LysM repeat protein